MTFKRTEWHLSRQGPDRGHLAVCFFTLRSQPRRPAAGDHRAASAKPDSMGAEHRALRVSQF